MKSVIMRKPLLCIVSLFAVFFIFTGCKTAKLIPYSSTADNEQKASLVRTEMVIIKGDNEKISRNYIVASAVDYMHDGRKNYYLIVAPALSGTSKPQVEDMILQYNYPFIIQARHLDEILKGVEKVSGEWDSTDMKYSGAVYSVFLSSPQNPQPWYFENRAFEVMPYVGFDYSKTARGANAKLTLGKRIEEVVTSTVDGKTVKSRVLFRDDSIFWIFDKSDKMRDFQNLLMKGLLDLKEKGMDNYYRKPEIKPEVKIVTPVVEKKPVKAKKRRR